MTSYEVVNDAYRLVFKIDMQRNKPQWDQVDLSDSQGWDQPQQPWQQPQQAPAWQQTQPQPWQSQPAPVQPQPQPAPVQPWQDILPKEAAWGGSAQAAAFNAALALGSTQIPSAEATGAWFSRLAGLRGHFNVSHSYVVAKLMQLIWPLYGRKKNAYSNIEDDTSSVAGQLRSSSDINKQPDLYIPIMAYLTYILLYGISKGALSNNFHPSMLYDAGAFAFVIILLEVLVLKGSSYMLGQSGGVSLWDQVALVSYKFVHLCIAVSARILLGRESQFYWGILGYCGMAASIALFYGNNASTGKNAFGNQIDLSVSMNYVVIGLAILQLPICWLLQPSAS